uniref:Uncharacterized protein n=1 Tax=Anguilla anguilla TaxID=7936 RepID=A0A0E9QIU7_ANGAN
MNKISNFVYAIKNKEQLETCIKNTFSISH